MPVEQLKKIADEADICLLYTSGKQQPEPDGLYTVKPDHGDLPQGCVFKRYRGSNLPGQGDLKMCIRDRW